MVHSRVYEPRALVQSLNESGDEWPCCCQQRGTAPRNTWSRLWKTDCDCTQRCFFKFSPIRETSSWKLSGAIKESGLFTVFFFSDFDEVSQRPQIWISCWLLSQRPLSKGQTDQRATDFYWFLDVWMLYRKNSGRNLSGNTVPGSLMESLFHSSHAWLKVSLSNTVTFFFSML